MEIWTTEKTTGNTQKVKATQFIAFQKLGFIKLVTFCKSWLRRLGVKLLSSWTEWDAKTSSILELKKEYFKIDNTIVNGMKDSFSNDKEIVILPSPKPTLYSSGA